MVSNNKSLVVNIVLILFVGILAYFIPKFVPVYWIQDLYFLGEVRSIRPSGFEGIGLNIGDMFVVYSLLIPLFFMIWGDRHKYWWILAALFPVVLLLLNPVRDDVNSVYAILFFPIIALIGAGLGFLLKKLLKKS